MKALVKKYPEPGLWPEDVPVPVPGIDEVLIKIHKTAICGTDLHIYEWNEWAKKTIKVPIVIGHEYVGTVEKIGSNVRGLKVGQLVSGEGHVVCGHCRNCRAGRRHLCRDTWGVGVNRQGAFAEYVCIPATNVWICDPAIPKDILACFDPFGNAVHTTLSFPIIGEDVLITGAGPIGIMAAAVARHAGARYVVVSDINPYRLELAKKMGATQVVDVREKKIRDIVGELGMREGFDVGLEMSGNPDALRKMLKNMVHGGKIALLGIPECEAAIDWGDVIFNGLWLKGIYGREMFETWYKMTVLIQGGLDLSPVITHRFDFTDYEKGFELMKKGRCCKIVLNWFDG